MSISKNVRYLRYKRGFSQDEIAERLGYKSYTTIQKWESGVSEPPLSVAHELAKIFNVDINDLVNRDIERDDLEKSELKLVGKVGNRARQYAYIPDSVSAGVPTTIEGIMDLPTISVPDYLLNQYAGDKDIFIMRVNGESMNRVIPNGSLIAVKHNYPLENLKNGDIVVFNYMGDYGLKRYIDNGDKVIFRPDSLDPTFTDIQCAKDENLHINGKVIMYTVNLV